MKLRVVILPQAIRDIDRNAGWWAERHSVDQAILWSETVYRQLESLAEFPQRNGLSAENGEFPYEIRDKLVGVGSRRTHRAIFTIKDDTVFVLSIRRGAQDFLQPSDIVPPLSG